MVSSGVASDPQALLQAAWGALRTGQAAHAVALCEQILRGAPTQPDALLLRGILHRQAGEAQQAEHAIERALAARPNFPYGHFIQGVHRLDGNRPAAAVPSFRRALELDATFAPAWATLGAALRQIGMPAAALDACTRALAAMPDDPACQCIRADALADLERFDEARALARDLVARMPADPRAWRTLAHVLERVGDATGAFEAVERWRALERGSVAADAALARLHDAAGRHDDAVALLEAAAARAPASADVQAALGSIALSAAVRADAAGAAGSRHVEAAVGHLERAHALSPDDRRLATRLGNALELLGRYDAAAAVYDRALALDPQRVESLTDSGRVRLLGGDATAAMPYLEHALARDPSRVDVRNEVGLASLALGRAERAIECFEAVVAQRSDPVSFSNLLLALQYVDGTSPAALLDRHRRYGAAVETSAIAPHANPRDPDRPLRIGYVSPDFGVHPVGFFTLPVLAAHDRDRVVVHCYSGRLVEDDVTAQIRAHAAVWRSTVGSDDAALAAQIRADGIDVLVDLAGHTAGNRLPVFARKPAPVQASWIGYFNTTGVGAIDYVLTDAASVPAGAERWFTETVVRLAGGRLCYGAPAYAPAVVAPPGRATGHVTFGSFNNLAKVTPAVIALWARVLAAVPTARLVLKWRSLADAGERARLQAAFAAVGVAAERLDLRPHSPHAQMLAEYGDIDIALDPFPFGGGLTSCEALWMGAPVVTLPGERPVSRQTLALLTQIDLTELAARDEADYVAIAARLAGDLDCLAALRAGMRARIAASPLGDAVRFTRGLEDAYRAAWQRWCARPF